MCTLRVGLAVCDGRQFVDHFSSSSKLDYHKSLNQCREKTNLAFNMSVDTNVEQGMLFCKPSEKYQSFQKISKYFTFPEFQEEFNF